MTDDEITAAMRVKFEEYMGRKIITEHVYPPIPIRTCDWVAYFLGDEESGPRGWGATRDEAIADLIEENG